jgi:hypothetical protein
VLADGSFVVASAEENADLFWAVCGGGDSRTSVPARRGVGHGKTKRPNEKAFDTFIRWFECRFHSVLVDLCDYPLMCDEI